MRICGVDEAGRGPLAGPVVAAAVVFKKGYRNKKIIDSKQLLPETREELVQVIKANCLQWAIVAVGPRRIEQINILEASRLAMLLCVNRVEADLILVDGNQPIRTNRKQKTIIGGDALRVEISAASILAKVYRDKLMRMLHDKYPLYGFNRHVGYPTAQHRKTIAEFGPCKIHRRTFSGVREFLETNLLCSSEANSYTLVENA